MNDLFLQSEKLNFIPPLVKFTWKPEPFALLVKDAIDSLNNTAALDFKYTLVGRMRKGKQVELISEHTDFLAEVANLYASTLVPNYTPQQFKIHEKPWVVLQRSGDYNPIHSHSGFLSAITYIKVPKSIGVLNDSDRQDLDFNPDGYISFIGPDKYIKIKPVEGEGYIFPSNLRHMVYPFFDDEDDTRISVAWNIRRETDNAFTRL